MSAHDHESSTDGEAVTDQPIDPTLAINKPVLLGALRAVGAARAVIEYSGSGDEGNANEIRIYDIASAEIDPKCRVSVTDTESSYIEGAWTQRSIVREMSLQDALSDFADRAINLYHAGFE
ncbi:hypothetical protein POK33_39755, partial [Burkholderia cenocepacia]